MNPGNLASIRLWDERACFIMQEFHVERVGYAAITLSAVPDHTEPFCDGTDSCATENHVIPAFREMVFDQPQNTANGSLN